MLSVYDGIGRDWDSALVLTAGQNHQFGSLIPTADETQARSKEKRSELIKRNNPRKRERPWQGKKRVLPRTANWASAHPDWPVGGALMTAHDTVTPRMKGAELT
ncbi:hypothetical protein EVAR_64182_1 [Eumeta japonica]|uniref:Uncharacterized protein n=1 Tax=Eumeta variegata TaxID=151549 RepID=A0A4C1ZJD9_EUMVA|nr:hypothetical protein EVAR_64182_1 [Eumeta japonica]